MTSCKILKLLRLSAVAVLAASVFAPRVYAQGPLPDAPRPSAPAAAVEPTLNLIAQPTPTVGEHKFWDRENVALFAMSAALAGADFAVTRANLRSGGQELNPVVRMMGTSTPALAANFAGETAGVMGLSYFFHRTGHHRMEHLVSCINASASAGAISYGLASR
ncbi:MAG TPA: hypothetical protein VMG31_14215 [Verrucomicrobiae bacterium]|nr:hypothetical protein [Verrucomicrobiae bacterium]